MNVLQFHPSRIILLLCALVGVITILYFLSSFHAQSLQDDPGLFDPDASTAPVLRPGVLGNFEPALSEPVSGPGEGGEAYSLPPGSSGGPRSESEYGMNMAVSNAISPNRTVRDTRHPECRFWHYPLGLPDASVVIVFHNEGLSVLMRTVHSVINRSPRQLLREVLLVDDFSDKADLREPLERYIAAHFAGRVRLHRNTEREGLIRTRNRGARLAAGAVVVFLDAHCEVNTNWLPPLLAPILGDRHTMTVPIIDGIDHGTFRYRSVYPGTSVLRGIFEWGMLYKEAPVPVKEAVRHEHISEPYRSPTHAGGLFAIERSYFLELGGYDPGLLAWGAENFELSFKIWQCGGSILWVPCSRVGHVYRGHMPYSFGALTDKVKGPLILTNYKRVIETWFDERHKAFFYTREPLAQYLDVGDLSAQLEFRHSRECRGFQWYMDKVAYDLLKRFPELPPNAHWGELVSGSTGHCVDTMGRAVNSAVGLSPCHGQGRSQLLRLNLAGQLGAGERCLEAVEGEVHLTVCRLGTVDGPWQYVEDKKAMWHRPLNKCLSAENRRLVLADCGMDERSLKWTWRTVKPRWANS
ncbi:N-acetylgalactosaminyltransferase 7-like [Amphibalanus amphitrite]|uniref:N-acetylgalactosaminyltransferase 7-like n=1 Tax=Amphibalanus amphitrite TaxID=1232801 RepID=UPI001C927696|nr:N-acetylgalactosaminyltransferase 7-like [Amphibalanus amphitrite]